MNTMNRCVWCTNHTMGEKCQDCLEGFFRGSEDHRISCRGCECHGHGDTCDPVTGEKCNCGNNTESDPTCQNNKNKSVHLHVSLAEGIELWLLNLPELPLPHSGSFFTNNKGSNQSVFRFSYFLLYPSLPNCTYNDNKSVLCKINL